MVLKKPKKNFFPPQMKKGESFNVLTSPYWAAVFVLVMLPFFVLLLYIGSFMNTQGISNEQLFAIYAIFAGLGSDIFLRRWLFVSLVIIRQPKVPFILFWVVGGIITVTFEPIKNIPNWFG